MPKPLKKKKVSLSMRVGGFFSDFRKFITKGNIMNLAVAVVIGAAFGKIVTSLVESIIMPLISLMVGGVSVDDWKWVITPEQLNADGTVATAENALRYGHFIQAIIDFLIIAFAIFLVLRVLMSLQKQWQRLESEMTNKEKHALVKQMRKQGMTKGEIAARLEEIAVEKATAAESMAALRASEEEEAKRNTTENILKDIRTILLQWTPPTPNVDQPPLPEIPEQLSDS